MGPSSRAGTYVTDILGSYRTFVADGFGADWNPAPWACGVIPLHFRA